MISPVTVVARNFATGSANKVHDGAVARQLGYSGALVPGVELFEHLARVPLAHFGPDWFERGELSARFRRPVYEGAPVVVTALERGDRLELSAEVDGVQCVEGVASLPAQDSSPPAGLQPVPPPPPGLLPPADEESLAPGVRLSIGPRQISRADSAAYLAAVDEATRCMRSTESSRQGYCSVCAIAWSTRTWSWGPGSTRGAVSEVSHRLASTRASPH